MQRSSSASVLPGLIAFALFGSIGIALIVVGVALWCRDNQCLQWPTPPSIAHSTATSLPLTEPPTFEPLPPTATTPQPPANNLTPFPEPPTPQVAAPGGQIAYAYGIAEESELYVMNADGSNVRQLTFNQYPDDSPTFSPDGRYLAFASARTDGYEIYVLDLATLIETQITNLLDKARFPSWSPVTGDDRVAFERRSNAGISIWMVQANGSDLQAITTGMADSRPSWSSNGQRILFGRALADTTQDGRITTADFLDIFVRDLATGAEQNLTNTPGADEHNMAWSPDGQWIAFARVGGDTNGDGFVNLDDQSDLLMMRPNGAGEVNVGSNQFSAFSPSWSPNGEQILFVRNVAANWNEIWVIDRGGSNAHMLTPGGPFFHPEWSK